MRLKKSLGVLAFVAAYFLLGRLGVTLAFGSAPYSAFWPPTGLAIGATIVWGYRMLPAIAVAAFVTILFPSQSLLTATTTALADTLEAFCAAFLVRYFCQHRNPLTHARDLFKFILLGAVLSPMVSALLGSTGGLLRGHLGGPYFYVLFNWWLQNLLGVLLFAPVVIALGIERPLRLPARPRLIKGCLLIGALGITAQWIFGAGLPLAAKNYPLEYLCIPFLVGAAFQFAGIGVSICLVLLSVLAVLGTQHGYGPFYNPVNDLESLHLLQLYLGTNAVFTLALAAIVAEREFIAKQLARSNAELERFAYVASHDLQEPLRTVGSFCQLLQRRCREQLDPVANEYIELAVSGAQRMHNVINSLLEYSRLGKKPSWQSTDCNIVVNEALANLNSSIQESGAEIVRTDLPVVPSDPLLLTPLFQNLISNALKFRNKSRPHIQISAIPRRNDWIFTVSDNGLGIEPQYREQIFRLFHRAHGPEVPPGNGVGLAVCKKIVEQHGGTIWVNSTPGSGSNFYFTLPNEPKSA